MPSKYVRKKDRSSSQEASQDSEHGSHDRELFLRAFEKPTQIYRYLKLRTTYTPLFLNRNLTFMKKVKLQGSKPKKTRPDDLLKAVEKARREREKGHGPGRGKLDCLNIIFSGFSDIQGKQKLDSCVTVDVSVVKILHHRRKDASTPVDEAFGQAVVTRGDVADEKGSNLSLQVNWFEQNNGHIVKAYKIKFRVTVGKCCKMTNGYHANGMAPPTKKRKFLPSSRPAVAASDDVCVLVGELPLFDRAKDCLFPDGMYEIYLKEECQRPSNCGGDLATCYSSWEELPREAVGCSPDVSPTLRFQVKWTEKALDTELPPQLEMVNGSKGAVGTGLTRESRHCRASADVGNTDTTESSATSDTESRTKMFAGAGSTRRRPPLFYHFIYGSSSHQMTAARNNSMCPWCLTNCRDLYGLLKHLRLSHPRFTFTYASSVNQDKIDVAVNESYDGSYAGNPHDAIGYAFGRSGPVCRTPVTQLLCLPRHRVPPRSLDEFLEADENDSWGQMPSRGHSRLYYHTVTNQPVRPHQFDADSDDENDPLWLREKTLKMIDEFTDVNGGEKELMKLWNLHIMSHNYLADCQVELACQTFVDSCGVEIVQKNIRRNFLLHLINLYDFGLLKPIMIHKLVERLNLTVTTGAPPTEAPVLAAAPVNAAPIDSVILTPS